jgi:uracil-DNA glycosylase
MRTCRLCLDAGFEISPGAVFTGRSSAEVMIIGQAPGVTEVEAGRPFNASSGRRLFQWLAEAGWEEVDFRERHYMTAVTKCFPGKSASGRGDRVPGKEEQAMCRSFLEEEVRYVEPRLIIPVGGLAIRLFYPASAKLRQIIGTAAYFSPDLLARIAGPFSIGQAENFGEFVAEKPSGGRWVVPLPHPSGASAWPNQADNRALIHRATAILAQIRRQWRL